KTTPPRYEGMRGHAGTWQGLKPQFVPKPVDTSVPREELQRVMRAITHVPEGFAIHPKIERQFRARWKDFEEGKPIDWAAAEAGALGTLLLEGKHVRLSGQDSRRGTFSHRHAVLYDGRTGEPYVPLNYVGEDQARFSVYDSLLSEAAVLGFEFGYS